jgi:hypothetical protein
MIREQATLSKKEKTVTRSIRVSESAFKALEEDAARRNVSLNTLVNQLFLEYANWGRFYAKIGSFLIARSTLCQLFDAASDEAVTEIGRHAGSSVPRAVIAAKHGALSLSTILTYLRNAAVYGGVAEYSEVENQGKKHITLMHNFGRKGSLFLTSYLEALFETVDHHPKLSSTEYTVIIEI